LRAHVEARLGRAPRYRQKLAGGPLGLTTPIWVDDDQFDIRHHVRRAPARDLREITDRFFSQPLDHERPLWELWIADSLSDGRMAVVGKAHHCMVDGLAAVELAALLLDPDPDPPSPDPDSWRPAPGPGLRELVLDSFGAVARSAADAAAVPARLALSPRHHIRSLTSGAVRGARALARSLQPAPAETSLNQPISAERHLARHRRPLGDLKRIKGSFGATVNDVVLAASCQALRRFRQARGEPPCRLKTMVPVSVRDGDGGDRFGNRLSFVFVDLPCDEPDPVRGLREVQAEMGDRKVGGEPEGGERVLRALEYAPQPLRGAFSRMVASPRTFNLVVSNIPGPREPLYMLGCELEEAYPVVPIPDEHDLAIGMTTVRDTACFGVYADRATTPDADRLAGLIGESIDELLTAA
jgi:WS/DGAT/MGAT family acyltransferase